MLVLITSFVIHTGICAQTFEGKMISKAIYTSKIPNVTSEQLSAMMGTTQEYYIKGAKYKTIMDGTFYQWQLYVPSENRLYNKFSASDTLQWVDGNSNPDEAVSYEIKKSQIKILGYNCDALYVKTKTGKLIYYFSKKIKIDPSLYKDHQYGNWALMINQTKSLPLKVEMETPQFTLVTTTLEINEMKLEDSVFELPKVPSKKSAY